MKLSAKFAVAVCLCLTLGGCYQSQRQMPPPIEPDEAAPQQSVIGPFGEEIPEPGRQSPFDQPQSEVTENPLQSEVSGALKPPSLQVINDRIAAYNQKLERGNDLDSKAGTSKLSVEQAARMGDCLRELQRILNGYNTLRDAVEHGDRGDVAENSVYIAKMQGLQQSDIVFLEGACGQLLSEIPQEGTSDSGQQAAVVAGLPQETEITALAAKKDYKAVEQAWLQIAEAQQEQLPLNTKMLYAEALVFLQKEEKAAEFYRQIVDRMAASEQSADPIALRKTLADLYVATGNYTEAQKQYIQISKDYLALGNIDNWAKVHLAVLGSSRNDGLELADYSGLVRNYLGYIPAQDGYKVVWEAEKYLKTYPAAPIIANVEAIKTQATETADKWFNGYLAEVNKLAEEKKYQEAVAKLKGIRTDIINDQQLDLINAKNDELVLAEAVEQETSKMAKLQELEQKWNNGLLLVKSGRYDEAISVYNAMNETEYAEKAEAKIKEIAELAAKDDRRKAADLFIRFTKTADIESKKKLLIESRRLLKDILVKYPRVEITDKVLGNIQRVEQEMNAIDPQLIQTIDSQGTAPQPREQPVDEQPVPATEDVFAPQPPIVETPIGQ